MLTYTYERQDIIQISLKRLPGGEECCKKGLLDLALPLHIKIQNCCKKVFRGVKGY
jgi:hypothetical protein